MSIKEILKVWIKNNKERLPLIDLLVELRENKELRGTDLINKQVEIEKKLFQEKEQLIFHTLNKINKNDILFEEYYLKFWNEIKKNFELFSFKAFESIEKTVDDPLFEEKVKKKSQWIKKYEKIYFLIWLESLSKGFLKGNFLKNTLFFNIKNLLETALIEYKVFDKEKVKIKEELLKSKITAAVNMLITIGINLNWVVIEGGLNGNPFEWSIKNELILNHVLIYAFIFNTKLPMITKPRPWKKKEKNNEFYYMGGYLSSDQFKNLGITDHIKQHRVLQLPNDFLKVVNYLQNQGLYVNEPFLDFLLSSDPKDFINDEFKYKIEKVVKIGKYSSKETKEVSINLEETIIYGNNNDNLAETILCNDIMQNFYILDSLRKYPFYFVFFIDFRGRLYPHGYPLNFYSNKLFKNCFIFVPEKNEKIVNYEDFKFYYDKLDVYSKKNFELQCENSKYNIYIGLDACASAFQIQGCLIKDRKILELTNILTTEESIQNDEKVYKDIYSWIGNNFPIDVIVHSFIGRNLTEKDKLTIIQAFKERSFLKSLIVPYSYNEGLEARKLKIKEYLWVTVFKSSFSKKYDIFNLSSTIVKEFDFFIDHEFPKLKILKDFLKKIASLKKSEGVLIKHFSFSFIQEYPKTKITESFKMVKGIRSHYKFTEIDFSAIDTKKQMISLLPNYIHSLDSAILISVLLKCMKKKIKIFTSHDCFYVNYYDINKIISIYASSFVDVLIKSDKDLLYHLAFDNSLHENTLIQKFLAKLIKDPFSSDEIKNILNSNVCLKP